MLELWEFPTYFLPKVKYLFEFHYAFSYFTLVN